VVIWVAGLGGGDLGVRVPGTSLWQRLLASPDSGALLAAPGGGAVVAAPGVRAMVVVPA